MHHFNKIISLAYSAAICKWNLYIIQNVERVLVKMEVYVIMQIIANAKMTTTLDQLVNLKVGVLLPVFNYCDDVFNF